MHFIIYTRRSWKHAEFEIDIENCSLWVVIEDSGITEAKRVSSQMKLNQTSRSTSFLFKVDKSTKNTGAHLFLKSLVTGGPKYFGQWKKNFVFCFSSATNREVAGIPFLMYFNMVLWMIIKLGYTSYTSRVYKLYNYCIYLHNYILSTYYTCSI